MTSSQITSNTLGFLKKLSKNNNRDWFNKNKETYLKAQENMIAFADALLLEMQKHDKIENESGKDSLMRIYRDTRFSKDKTPYKDHFGGGFQREGKKLRGDYYFQIGPDSAFAACGFYAPNPEDLLAIRKDIDYNFKDWKKLLANKKLRSTYGEIEGEKVASAPRGFAKDNPAIELLKLKQFYFSREFKISEIVKPGFYKELSQTFKNARPYLDYMSEVLSSDANGSSLL